MEETKEALNSMIINSDNPAAALDDAIDAIKKFLDEYAPLKKCIELNKTSPKTLDNNRPLQINQNQK